MKRLVILLGLACALACAPSSPGTGDGGSGDAGPDGGVGASADDPCGVRGTWHNGCPTVALCGSCAPGADYDLAYTFEIPADIAKDGGTWSVGPATLTFDVETCTLTVGGDSCTPLTPDEYELRNGSGTGTGYVHCRSAGDTCECNNSATCSPTRTSP